MHFLRAAFLFLLMMTFLPVSAVWAVGSSGAGGEDVYDRLKAGVKITQERVYETPEQPTVYLTFDDGPGKLTPKVLDILRDENVTATFFVLGEHVKQYPDSIKRMAEEGHSIGNHTYNHQYNNLYPVFKMFWDQIEQTDQTLQAAGVNTNLIRAPGGTFSHFDAFYYYYLDQAGYSVFDWNVDSGDALRANVPMAEIVRNVTSTALKHEMYVLMHDSSGHDETVRALPEIIRFYKERGYRFAPLSAKVKPIQSSLGKQKKTVMISRAEHEQWMKNMQDNAARKAGQNVMLPAKVQVGAGTNSQSAGKPHQSAAVSVAAAAAVQVEQDEQSVAQLVHQGELAIEESTAALNHKIHVPPLRLQIGQDTLEMEAPRYEFRDEKLYVPLRSLAERMGAMVSWEDERRTASVNYGLYVMKVDLQHHSISIESPGRAKQVIYLADVSMRDGSVVVPLRKAVELLGNRVAEYSLGDSLREVKLDTSSKGYSLICIPKLTVRV